MIQNQVKKFTDDTVGQTYQNVAIYYPFVVIIKKHHNEFTKNALTHNAI